MSSRDFVFVKGILQKPDDSLEDVDSNWSEEELLKLLEGVEKYDLSWYNIAENVGTKSGQQCFYRFYQYLIDDDILFNDRIKESQSDSDLWKTIVGQSSNPLMTFLSCISNICPYMAAEAAKSALRFFGEQVKESNPNMRLLTLKAANMAFDASLEYAKACQDEESNKIKFQVYQLTEKQIERESLKLKLLEDFTNHQRIPKDQKIPEQKAPV